MYNSLFLFQFQVRGGMSLKRSQSQQSKSEIDAHEFMRHLDISVQEMHCSLSFSLFIDERKLIIIFNADMYYVLSVTVSHRYV